MYMDEDNPIHDQQLKREARALYTSMLPYVESTFTLPIREYEHEKVARREFDRDFWYLPFPVTRVVEPFCITRASGTPRQMNGSADTIFDWSPQAQMAIKSAYGDTTNMYMRTASIMRWRDQNGYHEAYSNMHERYKNGNRYTHDVLFDYSLISLLDAFENRDYRYVERILPRQQRRADGLPKGSLNFIVVPKGERILYPPDELMTISQIKRRMHVVRGFMREYRDERYVNMRGQKQFIKEHIRGSLGTGTQIADYRVET